MTKLEKIFPTMTFIYLLSTTIYNIVLKNLLFCKHYLKFCPDFSKKYISCDVVELCKSPTLIHCKEREFPIAYYIVQLGSSLFVKSHFTSQAPVFLESAYFNKFVQFIHTCILCPILKISNYQHVLDSSRQNVS